MNQTKSLVKFIACSIFLITFFVDFAQTQEETFIEELQSEVEKEEQALTQQANDPEFVAKQQAEVNKMEGFLKTQINKISDPEQYEKLAKEIALGGVGLDGDGVAGQIINGATELMENHLSLLLPREFQNTMLTASIPQSRFFTDSYQCNPDSWPSNYFCGECTSRSVLGVCLEYGVTVSTHYRVPTQIASVSRDSDSSPWTLGLTKEISAQIDSGEIFEGIPAVGGLTKDLIDRAVDILNTIDFKRICVEAALNAQAMQIAIQAASGAAPKLSTDVSREILACIEKAIIDSRVIPNKKQFDDAVASGKLSRELAKRIHRNLRNQITAGTPGHTSFNYTLTSDLSARALTKQLQDMKVTYPNLRLYLNAFGGVRVEWAQDPSFVHFIKPPFKEPEYDIRKIFADERNTNSEGDFLGIEGDPQLAYNLSASSMSDASDPFSMFGGKSLDLYLATDPVAAAKKVIEDRAKFNIVKDVFDNKHSFTILNGDLKKLPYSEKWKQNLVVRMIDPRYSGDVWRSIQNQKNPYTCSNPKLSNQWQKLNAYGAPEMKRAFQVASKLSTLGILDSPTKKFFQGTARGINKFMADYQKDMGTFTQLCSTVTGATLGSKAGTVFSADKMGIVSKAFKVEFSDIESAGRRALTLPRPAKNPTELAMIDNNNVAYSDQESNPMFKRVGWPAIGFNIADTYTNLTLYQYMEKEGLGDRVLYTGRDLKKSNAPFIWNYATECAVAERSDKQAKAEAHVFPGSEAKSYRYHTAFNVCPEFNPIGPRTFVFPWGPIGMYIDFAIRLIPGSKGGLKDFNERWY